MSKLLFKNVTFVIGLSWLILGAMTYGIKDWDIGVSLVMAGFTYLTGEWVINSLLSKKPLKVIGAILTTFIGVQGVYVFYWSVIGKPENMVEGQWLPSLCMYLMISIAWWAYPMLQEVLGKLLSKKGYFSL
jgi:hypothetical protein